MINCKVALDIISENYPIEEVTALLEILPDEVQVKGDPCELIKGRVYRENIWSLYSKVDKEIEDIELHIKNLKDQLGIKIKEFKKIKTKFDIQCTCTLKTNTPASINLSQEILHFLSEIGAVLDIDQYIFPEDDS